MPRDTYANISEAACRAATPAEPPCFQSHRQWADYLLDCQQTIRRVPNRPFIAVVEAGARVVKYRPEFSFCRDCPDEHAAKMRATNICKPAHFTEVEKCN